MNSWLWKYGLRGNIESILTRKKLTVSRGKPDSEGRRSSLTVATVGLGVSRSHVMAIPLSGNMAYRFLRLYIGVVPCHGRLRKGNAHHERTLYIPTHHRYLTFLSSLLLSESYRSFTPPAHALYVALFLARFKRPIRYVQSVLLSATIGKHTRVENCGILDHWVNEL